jgi:methylmalonyl-CoA mutase cobalamin-binding subunit
VSAAEDAVRIVEASVVHPGDILVLSLGSAVYRDQLDQITEAIREKLPESVKLLVVGGDIQLHVLRASEAAQ